MIATLFVAMGIDFVHQIALFTAVIFVHNACAATMDVAIDALAVSVLPEHERGSANGFMFAGASIGQTIGGSGVLFLTAVMPFSRPTSSSPRASSRSRSSSSCRCASRR